MFDYQILLGCILVQFGVCWTTVLLEPLRWFLFMDFFVYIGIVYLVVFVWYICMREVFWLHTLPLHMLSDGRSGCQLFNFFLRGVVMGIRVHDLQLPFQLLSIIV